MARRDQTLIELSLNQQVRAANRQAFATWWRESISPGAILIVLLSAGALVTGAVIWRMFR
jgi:hypothetical protein